MCLVLFYGIVTERSGIDFVRNPTPIEEILNIKGINLPDVGIAKVGNHASGLVFLLCSIGGAPAAAVLCIVISNRISESDLICHL